MADYTLMSIINIPSIPEGQERCNSSPDPVFLGLVRRQLEEHDEVGRVTGGRQCSSSRNHLVDGAVVNSLFGCDSIRFGNQVDEGKVCINTRILE